ncbi:hypothetical protein ACO2Q2_06540 [Dyella sp. KRB-257]|uniref:hypothetical protein n=1 Tax=Dyella sp. KRB-257 TaxID=3400915 RepID=UPI003BFDE2F5
MTMAAKRNASDDVAITYADFLLLAHVEDSGAWAPGVRIDKDGVWVDDLAGSEHHTQEERHVLMAHPDGDTRKPVIAFPTTLGELRLRLLPTIGMGWLDPFELADFVAKQRPRAVSKWPWGNHETKLLRDLEAAGRRYLGDNYDPDDSNTAPKSKDVAEWLQSQQKTPKRDAEVFAKMLKGAGKKTGSS